MDIKVTSSPTTPQRGVFVHICLAIEGRKRAADLLRRSSESPATPPDDQP
jgi:hypothetical protein